MANLDGSVVRSNPGTLTYTPDGGVAKDIGFTVEGIQLRMKFNNAPITPEEFGELPLDYINLMGPILATGVSMQLDDETRQALADYAISGATLLFTTADIGRKQTDLGFGALAFAPSVVGAAGWTAPRVVPLLNEETPFEPKYKTREIIEWAFSFGILPPTAGGTSITLT